MNHGRLGYISGQRLRVPPDILDQMGLRRGNLLFGVYYRPNLENPDYQGTTVEDDFMLTPLLPAVWDRSGCFIVRLKHRAEAFVTIAKFLANHNLSIYCSECTRSAYRYATWNLHVVVNGLPDRLTYDKTRSGYTEAIQFLETAKEQMEVECSRVLFEDSNEPDMDRPVSLLHLSALSYFAHHYHEMNEGRLPFKPFRLRVDKEGFLLDEGRGFAQVLAAIRAEQGRDLRDSVFFVEADRRNYNMRLAVFAGPHKSNLFVARAKYTSTGNWNEFRGLLARIASQLPATCKIWKCSNEKLEVRENYEDGIIKMIVEDGQPSVESKAKIQRITDALAGRESEFAPRTKVHPPIVRLATLSYCRERITADFAREAPDRPLVFISYPSGLRAKAKQVKAMLAKMGAEGWLDKKDLGRGKWLEQIKRALKRSSGLIVLWTPQCRESEWVTMEWQAAVILEIPITVFLMEGAVDSLPRQLQEEEIIPYGDAKRRNTALEEIAKEVQTSMLLQTN